MLKELNATRRLGLPDVDGLVIESRTRTHREVGMKQEMEEMALWLWESFERWKLKSTLEGIVGRVDLQGVCDDDCRVRQHSHHMLGLL